MSTETENRPESSSDQSVSRSSTRKVDCYPSPVRSSVSRLWRPAAQRNLRNQWSKLVSGKQEWFSASASGRTHATALVNAYLSQRYMASMELGVLKDLPDIRTKACRKLSKQQEFHRCKLLSSYASLVAAVSQMVNARESMRCFTSQTSDSPIMKFSNSPVQNDNGDGGGFPVFTFLSIPFSQNLAQELVGMFELELTLKRLLVMELLAVGYEEKDCGKICCWHDELYSGEYDDLALCHLYKTETGEVSSTGLKGRQFDVPSEQNSKLNNATLQAYLTTWIAAINVDSRRVDEILAIVGEDMTVSFR